MLSPSIKGPTNGLGSWSESRRTLFTFPSSSFEWFSHLSNRTGTLLLENFCNCLFDSLLELRWIGHDLKKTNVRDEKKEDLIGKNHTLNCGIASKMPTQPTKYPSAYTPVHLSSVASVDHTHAQKRQIRCVHMYSNLVLKNCHHHRCPTSQVAQCSHLLGNELASLNHCS